MGKVESIFKSEIMRLATREVRKAFLPLRREVRAMKGKLSAMTKMVSSLDRLAKGKTRNAETQELKVDAHLGEAKKSRFTPARIHHLRLKLGLSQNELAKLTDVTLGAVGLWEKGKFSPKLDKKAALLALRKMGKRTVKKLLQEKMNQKDPKQGKKPPQRIPRKKRRAAKK
jgi:DNA-binding transcriptional regulator YiaG